MASVKMTPTPFMIKLKEDMKEQRGISDSTVNTYIANLCLLNKKPFNNLGFLKRDKEAILEHLTQYAESTESNYLSSIVSALSTHRDQHLYKSIYKFYSELLNEKLGKKDGEDHSKLSESQKDNWISWDDVEKKWKELKTQVDKFKDDKSISKKSFETLVDFVVLSLYTLVPPRRNLDYLKMNILTRETKDLPTDVNYCDMINEEFIFNVYKTSKFHKQQIEKIPEELMEVLRVWVKFHPSMTQAVGKKPGQVKMFVNVEGIAQTLVNFITLRLNKIFNRKVASTMLRHIYITHKFGDEFEEMARTASAMGHTVSEQRDYAKKVSKPSNESE
jgi:hypothetical protein